MAPDPRKEAVLTVIRSTGLTPRQAAISTGISAPTYYRWVDDDPAFRDAIAEAEATFERRMAAGIVHDAVSLKSWRAKAWILEHRQGFAERWQAVSKIDMTVDDGRRAEMESMTDAELSDALEKADRDRLRRMDPDQLERWQAEIAELLTEKGART